MKPVLNVWWSHFWFVKLRYFWFIDGVSPLWIFGCYLIFCLRPHLIYSNWNVHYMSISLNLQDFKSLSTNTMSYQFCLVILQDSWDAIKGVQYETLFRFTWRKWKTFTRRTHCSRMHTIRYSGRLGGRVPPGGCLPRGISTGGVCPGGVSAQGECLPRGVSA